MALTAAKKAAIMRRLNAGKKKLPAKKKPHLPAKKRHGSNNNLIQSIARGENVSLKTAGKILSGKSKL